MQVNDIIIYFINDEKVIIIIHKHMTFILNV